MGWQHFIGHSLLAFGLTKSVTKEIRIYARVHEINSLVTKVH